MPGQRAARLRRSELFNKAESKSGAHRQAAGIKPGDPPAGVHNSDRHQKPMSQLGHSRRSTARELLPHFPKTEFRHSRHVESGPMSKLMNSKHHFIRSHRRQTSSVCGTVIQAPWRFEVDHQLVLGRRPARQAAGLPPRRMDGKVQPAERSIRSIPYEIKRRPWKDGFRIQARQTVPCRSVMIRSRCTVGPRSESGIRPTFGSRAEPRWRVSAAS